MSESLSVEELDPRDDADWATVVEVLELMVLDDKFPDRVVYIGSLLDSVLRDNSISQKESRCVYMVP